MPRRNDDPIALLVRHPKDTLSDSGVYVSWTDVDLTEAGRVEAEKTATFLKQYDISAVYSSPLKRAVDMASICFPDGEIIQHRGLLPFNRGVLTLIPESEGDDALKLFLSNPDVKIPGGESRTGAENRIQSFFGPALEQAEKETAAFFTHHSVIDILNCLCRGERPDKIKNLVKPAGVVAVFVDDDGYRLEPVLNEDDSQTGIS